MTKKSQVKEVRIDGCFNFSEIRIDSNTCLISGEVKISNLPLVKKEFLKQIRGKNLDPIKAFSTHLRDLIGRYVKEKHRVYGEVAAALSFEDDNQMIFRIDAILHPEVPELKLTGLETIAIEKFAEKDYEAYLSAIKNRSFVTHESDEPIQTGNIVVIRCEFEGEPHEEMIRVDHTLREPLRTQLLNKKTGDEFKYEFHKSDVDQYLDQHPEYAEYKKFFKKYRNIEANIQIVKIYKERAPQNEEELIKALKLNSKEELTKHVTTAMEQELVDMNYKHYRKQLLERIKNQKFVIPKSLVKAEMHTSKHSDENKAEERLMHHFQIDHLKRKIGVTDKQIHEIISQHYKEINDYMYHELRNMIILNSYIRWLIESNAVSLAKRMVNSLTEGREVHEGKTEVIEPDESAVVSTASQSDEPVTSTAKKASDSMTQDRMTQDRMTQDRMTQDRMTQDRMTQDRMTQDKGEEKLKATKDKIKKTKAQS